MKDLSLKIIQYVIANKVLIPYKEAKSNPYCNRLFLHKCFYISSQYFSLKKSLRLPKQYAMSFL